MNDIDKTLQERLHTHGDFRINALVSQQLKAVVKNTPNWSSMSPVQHEAIEVVLAKIARICVGDANFKDNYRDIIGYTQLAIDELDSIVGARDVVQVKTICNGEGLWELVK
jgi:hypothetical protein